MAHIAQLSEHLAISRVSIPATFPPNPTDTPLILPYFFSHRYPLSFLIGIILLPRGKGSMRLLRSS